MEILRAYMKKTIDGVVVLLGVCDGEDLLKIAVREWAQIDHEEFEALRATGLYQVRDLCYRRGLATH